MEESGEQRGFSIVEIQVARYQQLAKYLGAVCHFLNILENHSIFRAFLFFFLRRL